MGGLLIDDLQVAYAGWAIPSMVAIALVTGLLAGVYPAFFMSRYRPASILRESTQAGGSAPWIRRVLVGFQFAVSIVLLVTTAVMIQQRDYMMNMDPMFDKENILILRFDRSYTDEYRRVKADYARHPQVLGVSASHSTVGYGGQLATVKPEGYEGNKWQMRVLGVDEGFIDVYGLKLVAGRNFSADVRSDSAEAFILNETAVRQLGWENPIGKRFEWPENNRTGQVIGVVRDFHSRPLREPIRPMVMCMWQSTLNIVSIKLAPGDRTEVLQHLSETYQRLHPERNFWSGELEQHLEGEYDDELELATTFGAFSGLAILIASMGLLGLVAFSAQQRRREIGVRRVLGATVVGVVSLLSREFVKLIVAANIVVAPLLYFGLSNWLNDFAFRIDIGPVPFVLGGVVVLVLALTVVSVIARIAASANPVASLRCE